MYAAILRLIVSLLPFFVKNKGVREEIRKNILRAVTAYEIGADDPAKLRDAYDKVEEDLVKKWHERWGNQGATEVTITPPLLISKSQPFAVRVTGHQPGDQLKVDKMWLIQTLGSVNEYTIILNTGGERTIDVFRGEKLVGTQRITVR